MSRFAQQVQNRLNSLQEFTQDAKRSPILFLVGVGSNIASVVDVDFVVDAVLCLYEL